MKIYVLINSKVLTGGPKALLQLGGALSKSGADVSLVFPDSSTIKIFESWMTDFCPEAEACVLEHLLAVKGVTIVIPETGIKESLSIVDSSCNKVWLYMLSVDNAQIRGIATGSLLRNIFLRLRNRNSMSLGEIAEHVSLVLTQSRYSEDLLSGADIPYYYVGDYIDQEFDLAPPQKPRCGIVTNGNKGGFFKFLIRFFYPSLRITELKGVAPSDVPSFLKSHELYLDLGGQPGKDRLPRECLKLGVPVLLLTRGAAKNGSDFPYVKASKLPLRGLLNLKSHLKKAKTVDLNVYQTHLKAEREEFHLRVSKLVE